MTQQLLYIAYVCAALQQMGDERVAQAVKRGVFLNRELLQIMTEKAVIIHNLYFSLK